jgi:hypothetical protein
LYKENDLQAEHSWVSENGYSATNDEVPDTGYDNMATGVTIFRGLPRNASLSVRVAIGLEMLVAPESPIRSFVSQPTLSDPRAIGVLYQVAESMRLAYPARFNATAALVPLLAKAVKHIAPYFAPALASGSQALGSWAARSIQARLQAPQDRPAPRAKLNATQRAVLAEARAATANFKAIAEAARSAPPARRAKGPARRRGKRAAKQRVR